MEPRKRAAGELSSDLKTSLGAKGGVFICHLQLFILPIGGVGVGEVKVG